MKQFLDVYGNRVELAFSSGAFEEEIRHVLVICRDQDHWLLTNHKQRGLEFPGGKREAGETLEDAARRETFEETGAVLDKLEYIAAYRVTSQTGSFVKAVFYGKVDKIEKTNSYFETNGPITIAGDILADRFSDKYSFIMKDEVIEECIKYIQKEKGQKE